MRSFRGPATGVARYSAMAKTHLSTTSSVVMTTVDEENLGEVFRAYIQAKRELLVVTHRCYLKGWPDRKSAVESLTNVSLLIIEQELLRFDHLLSGAPVDPTVWKSLESILRRISNDWRDSDEVALIASSSAYRDIANRLAAAPAIDKAGLDEPGKAARGDPELQNAVHTFNKKHDELDRRLVGLCDVPSNNRWGV